MYRILKSTADTYITNRITRNSFRTTDANVGQAGTLDLFKLAGESTISFVTASVSGSSGINHSGSNVVIPGNSPFVSGTTDPIELSRVLIQFDLDPLRELTGSILDLNSSNFTCTLQLFDVMGGQTLPSNFQLIVFPLARSFDEGLGRDVNAYEDIDAANFITASISGDTAVTWSQEPVFELAISGSGSSVFVGGAGNLGFVGQEFIDAITGSTSLGDLFVTQLFSDGSEDLSMDITTIISATLTEQIPDLGFRISFSGSHETDDRTRFVKRFVSRHSTNTRIQPRILVGFDDSIQDNHINFVSDVSGTLFLNSFVRGQPANLVSGSAATEITGLDSLSLTLTSGSVSGTFTKTITASQHRVGNNFITGVYSASFAIDSNETLLSGAFINYGSSSFDAVWGSLDGTVLFLSSSLVVESGKKTSFSQIPDRLTVNITNLRDSYKATERVRFHVFVQDAAFPFIFTKTPLVSESLIFERMFYRVCDVNSNEIILPFDTTNNATRLSSDSDGMYFDLFMSDLDVGRVYAMDLLIDEGGTQQIFEHVRGSFRIDT